jgi:hypothetical protein
MNPAQAKIASWALATVTGAALCIYVFASIKTHADQARNVSTEEMTTRLNATLILLPPSLFIERASTISRTKATSDRPEK